MDEKYGPPPEEPKLPRASGLAVYTRYRSLKECRRDFIIENHNSIAASARRMNPPVNGSIKHRPDIGFQVSMSDICTGRRL